MVTFFWTDLNVCSRWIGRLVAKFITHTSGYNIYLMGLLNIIFVAD